MMAMLDLPAAARLGLWQAAEGRDPIDRSLLLAAAAEGGTGGEDQLARLPLGRRDTRLLALHRALGGGALEATSRCPDCGEPAEFAVDPDALLARAADTAPPAELEAAGFVVVWRSPDSRDVAAAAAAGDAATAESVLVGRCVTAARGPDGDVEGTALPAAAREALAQAMADADPLAEVLVGVSCPGCSAEFVADLDVAAFVWAELRADAQRLLREVNALARTYGWTEPEVLALDDDRRAAYLELVREGVA
jgi:hypothetical protein